ncbi:MAG: prepilin-type N-terminal cleavage/methylation domain-containing protein [Planctomycetota bacterium]|nr:prepilin-type N-terminal cleavage/methylation domain-containing protein [Planctomycetota bacterium]
MTPRPSRETVRSLRRRGMTLVELIMALAIACLVGSGVVAMTESVARVMVDGRIQKENTTASATASSRLAMIVAPSNCPLLLTPSLVACWGSDTHRDGRIQASELRWIRFDGETGTLHLDQLSFPEGFGPRDMELSNRTLAYDEDFARFRRQLLAEGLLDSRLLLDGLAGVELAMTPQSITQPIEQNRISWRLLWSEDGAPNSEVLITTAIHAPRIPEDSR